MILAIAAVAAAAEEEAEVVAAVGVALTKSSLFGFSGQPMQSCRCPKSHPTPGNILDVGAYCSLQTRATVAAVGTHI